MRVTDHSMEPGLREGAVIIAHPIDARTRLQAGDVVIARRPEEPDREIIKRIRAIDAAGGIFLVADNPAGTDSYHFGPVRREDIIARVRWRYWPLPPKRL